MQQQQHSMIFNYVKPMTSWSRLIMCDYVNTKLVTDFKEYKRASSRWYSIRWQTWRYRIKMQIEKVNKKLTIPKEQINMINNMNTSASSSTTRGRGTMQLNIILLICIFAIIGLMIHQNSGFVEASGKKKFLKGFILGALLSKSHYPM